MKGPHMMRWNEVIRINYDLFDFSIQKDDKKVQRIRKEDGLRYVWIYSDKNKEKRLEPMSECTDKSCAEYSKKENEFIKYVAEQFGIEIIDDFDDLIKNPNADYTYLFRFIGGFFPIRYLLGRYSKGYLNFLEKYNIKLESKYIGAHEGAYCKYFYPSDILYDNV